mmetsp:Transcript_2308/g.4698  ORF Transcript_2308/g.4698 Transcript_2308/m.4698 type:complete len:202 (-) Transcript_2308:765-1370(-)
MVQCGLDQKHARREARAAAKRVAWGVRLASESFKAPVRDHVGVVNPHRHVQRRCARVQVRVRSLEHVDGARDGEDLAVLAGAHFVVHAVGPARSKHPHVGVEVEDDAHGAARDVRAHRSRHPHGPAPVGLAAVPAAGSLHLNLDSGHGLVKGLADQLLHHLRILGGGGDLQIHSGSSAPVHKLGVRGLCFHVKMVLMAALH